MAADDPSRAPPPLWFVVLTFHLMYLIVPAGFTLAPAVLYCTGHPLFAIALTLTYVAYVAATR